jgi:hypothetical protein
MAETLAAIGSPYEIVPQSLAQHGTLRSSGRDCEYARRKADRCIPWGQAPFILLPQKDNDDIEITIIRASPVPSSRSGDSQGGNFDPSGQVVKLGRFHVHRSY